MRKHFYILMSLALLASCSSGSGEAPGLDISAYPDTALTIHDKSQLIGGPVAQGRVGDVLLANDRIRVIIQKPRKNAGVNSFGGNIIDADIVRPAGEAGQDNFGSMFPLVNIEWTVNYHDYEVVSDGSGSSPKVLRAKGKIDVYEYLDLDFIGEVAEAVAGQRVAFSNRFDDRRNPFEIYKDMRSVSNDVITEYTLEPGRSYVRIDTTFENGGDKPVKMPVGQFINGSGQLSMLVPGVGFTPDLMAQAGSNTPAIIYAAFDGVDVSYGYFFDPTQFMDEETGEPRGTTSISYSDVTGVLFGEEFLKLTPLGGGDPIINFEIPANASRTITSYFVVGDGSAGSVMDAGLEAIGAAVRPISGTVRDAGENPVAGATVAVMYKGQTLIAYRTDSRGRFSGNLPTGGDAKSKQFGNGSYKVIVEYPGYHLNGAQDAGKCTPGEIDIAVADSAQVICTLGETGTVEISGPIIDAETAKPVVARLTIVGEDPSPNKVGSAGRFRSTYFWEPMFGIADVKYIAADGTFDLSDKPGFNIEPGTYRFVVSRGPEYTTYETVAEVAAGGSVKLENISLSRAARTPGYIGTDLHVHSVSSPDSPLSRELRALAASGEGLDVLQSSDHDFLTDYEPVVSAMMAAGKIPPGSLKTAVGDEVTPNHYGHMNAYPLTVDSEDPEGDPVDWSLSPKDEMSPAPDYVLTLDELIAELRGDPGENVIQINHFVDNPTGILLACGWVTSTAYIDGFGVMPLSSYADPVERRMPPHGGDIAFPIEYGDSGLMTADFDVVELVVGGNIKNGTLLFRSAIPTWFNLLNLGKITTAVADGDSHTIAPMPIGLPRNFIASSADPQDDGGDHGGIDLEEYAANIKAHHVTISAGPVVMMSATAEGGAQASIGDTVAGRKVSFNVEVSAPSWGWFDTVEVYANTETLPVDDATDLPMEGTASDPAEFYKPYHVPRYTYAPIKSFKLSDGTLENWKEEGGVITASVAFTMEVNEDTWVVALARGTQNTPGYRSLFPFATNALKDKADVPEAFDPADLTEFHADKRVGAVAWGITNPIFIDADGDGFVAKYVREGKSPIH